MTDGEPIFKPEDVVAEVDENTAASEDIVSIDNEPKLKPDDVVAEVDENTAASEDIVPIDDTATTEDEQVQYPKRVKKVVKKKVVIKSNKKNTPEELDFSKYGKRRQSRLYAMFSLYSYDVNGDKAPLDYLFSFDYQKENVDLKVYEYAKEIIKGTLANIDLIDNYISEGSKNWNIERIHYVDKAILRFSLYSLLFEKSISKNIVIDEAVEIAKDFSKKDSYKFINGILDGIEASKQN